jgi:hypothetical protein
MEGLCCMLMLIYRRRTNTIKKNSESLLDVSKDGGREVNSE